MSQLPLVSVKNLTVKLATTELVNSVSFEIAAGETFGLVGESGSGKSLSALSLLQLLAPGLSAKADELSVCGLDVLQATSGQLQSLRGAEVGCIFQEPMTSLNPLQTIEKQLAESLYLHRGWSLQKARPCVLEWLKRVELRNPEKKMTAFPHQLSGGERQRVMIAMALINEPKLLIADEPTTALDVTVQAQILALIAKLQSSLGMAVLLISHDLGVVQKMAKRLAVMRQGELLEQGSSTEVLKAPQHTYTQALIAAEPSGEPTPVLSDEVLLKAEDVRVWFPVQRGVLRRTVGHIKAVDGVSMSLKKGQTLGVVGESGSGKSTLAKALLGLEKMTGHAEFNNQPLQGLTAKQWQPLRRQIQIVFQDPYGSLSPRMSVRDIVAEGLVINKIGDAAEQEDRVVETLRRVGLNPDDRHRYPNAFSGGQRQRIALARALVVSPKLIVLDEPTSSLDRTVQAQLVDLLKQLQAEQQLSYLFISHDLTVVKALAHDVLVMQQGKVVEQGLHVFDAAETPYSQQLVQTAFDYALKS